MDKARIPNAHTIAVMVWRQAGVSSVQLSGSVIVLACAAALALAGQASPF